MIIPVKNGVATISFSCYFSFRLRNYEKHINKTYFLNIFLIRVLLLLTLQVIYDGFIVLINDEVKVINNIKGGPLSMEKKI